MMGYWDGSTYTNGHSAWMGVFMMILIIIVIVALVLLVVWAMRRHDRHDRQYPGAPYPMNPASTVVPIPPQDDPACGAARLRFAKGEITKEELEDICSILKNNK